MTRYDELPKIQNMRQIWTRVMRMFSGRNVALSITLTSLSYSWSESMYCSTPDVLYAIGYAFSSSRNVAAASKMRKQRCDSV